MADRTDAERTASFVRSFMPDLPGLLAALETKCRESFVPVIRKETQSVLRTMLLVKRPENILEIGTGIGFSALFMAEFSDAGITTIEHAPQRIREAREHFQASAHADRIRLLPGDAEEILPSLEGSFDFIFMDAAKGQYGTFFPEVFRLLSPGGVLVTDNILQEGTLAESHYTIPRRERTIHKRMREYLYEITHHPDLDTTILTEGDGIALSVKSI